jgi:spore coat protein U-like protein
MFVPSTLRHAVGLTIVSASLGAGSAAAQTSANLSVSASVVANCTVSTGSLAFGAYDPTAGAAVDGSGTFDVTCTQGTVATLALGPGQHGSGGARRLHSGGQYLTYELYKDSGRSDVWGSASAALSLSAAPSNSPRSVTVFGRISGSQNVAVGAYTDTVVISVTF